jgi:nucleoside-diphosphate-sugar epimerase
VRVLILGGTGLTGRAMAARLAADGHAVACLARGTTDVGVGELAGAALLRADRRDRAALARAFAVARPDAVIDQIAFAGDDVDRIADLLDHAHVAGPTRHLVCSSAAVLGSGLDLDEGAAVAPPATGYLAGKLAVEARARARGAIVLRPAYLHGPGHPPLTVRGRDATLLARLRAGDPVELPGDGALPLQPTFAADHAAAVAAILTAPAPAPCYHVGGPPTTWRGWLAALAEAAGTPLRAREVALDELTAGSPWFRDYLRHPLTIRSARLPPLAWTPLAAGARALVAWLSTAR